MLRRVLIVPLVLLLPLLASCTDDDCLTGPGGLRFQRVTNWIGAGQYLNNRFFRLDLPPLGVGYPVEAEAGDGQVVAIRDFPGRNVLSEFIDPNSVRVFLNVSGQRAQPGDVDFVAVYLDSTGRWAEALDLDAVDPVAIGQLWRPVDFQIMLDDHHGTLVALDLKQEYLESDMLAVVYDVVGGPGGPTGSLLYRVGDRPELGPPTVDVDGDGTNDYRMKLLKPAVRDPITFHYILRNIYALGQWNIDHENFDLQIWFNGAWLEHPELDLSGLPWIQIFGLDRMGLHDSVYDLQPDGVVDKHDPYLFDLQRGLLKFPLDMYQPFNMTEEYYTELADTTAFVWDQSLLSGYRIPEIYDWMVNPTTYEQYENFLFKVTYLELVAGVRPPIALSLQRQDWMWASPPAQGDDPDFVALAGDDRHFWAAGRVPTVRWFIPRERVRRQHLDPEYGSGSDRLFDIDPYRVLHGDNPTVPTLQIFLRAGDGGWRPDSWGGIMRGLGPRGVDISQRRFLDIWINDFQADPANRRGTIHVDLGYISEDFYWPDRYGNGEIDTLTFQLEDRNRDGVFVAPEEDTGLDGEWGGGDQYSAEYASAGNPYPGINGTEHNNREDSEDLDRNTVFGLRNGYFTLSFELAEAAEIDVLRDYSGSRIDAMAAENIAWRKYRLDLLEALTVSPQYRGEIPDMSAVTHLRIWYEDNGASPPQTVNLQIAELRFER